MAARCLIFALALCFIPTAQCDEVRAVPKALTEKAGAIAGAAVPSGAAEPPLDTHFDTGEEAGATELLKALLKSLHKTTKAPNMQWGVALFAFLLGLAALGDGKTIFKFIVIILCAAAGFIFALATFKDTWEGEKKGELMAYIVSAEIALAVGVTAYKGVEGVRFGLGMSVGFLMFQEAKVLCEAYATTDYLATPLYAAVAGTVLVVFGLFLFCDYMESTTLGFLAPILGAGSVVAALGYFVMFGISFIPEETQQNIFAKGIAGTPLLPEIPPFEDYLLMLFTMRKPKIVGFFSASSSDTTFGSFTIHWDLWLGRFFLIVFSYLGIYYQWKKDAKARKINKRVKGKGPQAEALLVKKTSKP